MKKGFEYQFTVSTSTKRKNFAVAYRQNSTIGQSTQTSSHLDSGSLANYQSFFVGAFSKSTEENQIDEFITSKLSAFDLPVCFTDTTLSLLDKPNNKNITKNSSSLSLQKYISTIFYLLISYLLVKPNINLKLIL